MDPNRTPEEATEILARELWVRFGSLADGRPDREVRGAWYRNANLERNERFRSIARGLQEKLAGSGLVLTWTEDDQ